MTCIKKLIVNCRPVQQRLDLSEPLIPLPKVPTKGECGLCLTKDIPMANKLFCIHCHEFYFE
jgi:hypothetical protein